MYKYLIAKPFSAPRVYRYLFFYQFLLISSISFSQTSISGKVIDEQGESLSYATIALISPLDSILKYYGLSDDEGYYKIKGIRRGEYLLQYSYVGKQVFSEGLSISKKKGERELGTRVLLSNTLKEVTVVESYIPVIYNGDTTEFNTKAFMTKPNAVVEDLLDKIPGIEVDESGNVKALGKDVVNVLVEGKEFFGKDIKVATKNLPAESIDKVQVYDKRSDEVEFSGIDDGKRERTINLKLKNEFKKGYFGNAKMGGSLQDYYDGSLKLFRFNKKTQFTAFGDYKNTNNYAYTSEITGDRRENIEGVSSKGSAGINFLVNGKGKDKYYVNYLLSAIDAEIDQHKTLEQLVVDGILFQTEDFQEESRTLPHGIVFGLRNTSLEKQSITLNGSLRVFGSNADRGFHTISSLDDHLISNLSNSVSEEALKINGSVKLGYIYKINDIKTQFRTDISAQYNSVNSFTEWQDSITYLNIDSLGVFSQHKDEYTSRSRLEIMPSLIHQLWEKWHLNLGLGVKYANDIFNRDQDYTGGIMSGTNVVSEYSTMQTSMLPGATIQRSSKKTDLRFSLISSVDFLDRFEGGVRSDHLVKYHFLPAFRYSNRYEKGKGINIDYSTSFRFPEIRDLYTSRDNVNYLYNYLGNASLEPEFQHRVNLAWNSRREASSTFIRFRVGFAHTRNKIGQSRSTDTLGITTIMPVNTPEYNSLNSQVSYLFPIRPLGIKLDLDYGERFASGYSIIDEIENTQKSATHTIGLSLRKIKSEKLSVSIRSKISLTNAKYSIVTNNRRYMTSSLRSNVSYHPNNRWVFDVRANVLNYSSQSFREDILVPTISAEISYSFLKNERATISLEGNDLLDQVRGIDQSNSENYLVQREWNTLGRYVMLYFTMKFGKR